MDKLPKLIIQELLEFRESQELLVQHYQNKENLEMAYLTRWSILEKLVKTVASEFRRQSLISSLHAWLAYATKGKQQPSKNPNTAIELKVLPKKGEFIASLNQYGLLGQDVWLVVDSNGRHRRNRNEIAHTGKKFINYLAYMKLMTEMSEIINRVYSKIEPNKRIQRTQKTRR